jgi:hypothetical protein
MKAALAEMLGSALLLAMVVGSGIMGERLADGNTALVLLANALATGFGLVAHGDLYGNRALGNPRVRASTTGRRCACVTRGPPVDRSVSNSVGVGASVT